MKKIYKALADFQQEVPIIHKGSQGYGYAYTDLPEIFKVINPLLKKHGLGFTQLVNGDTLTTVLFHPESGEEIVSETHLLEGVSLAKMNQFQVLGSQITYLRRYALSSMLGLVTDKDVDANGNEKKESSKKPEVKPKRLTQAQKIKMNEEWTNPKDFQKVLDTFVLTDKERTFIEGKIKELKDGKK